jgi:hypothetical protein
MVDSSNGDSPRFPEPRSSASPDLNPADAGKPNESASPLPQERSSPRSLVALAASGAPDGGTTTLYDALGRVIATISPLGRISTTHYDVIDAHEPLA